MGLFRRSSGSPFPDDMVRWLETFGRFSFDVHGSGIDGGAMWDRLASLHAYASGDPQGFLTALRRVVAGDQGGFATFGAARLVWEMYSGDALRMPAAWPLIDAGIEFKISRGLPTLMFTGYEMQRLDELRAQAD